MGLLPLVGAKLSGYSFRGYALLDGLKLMVNIAIFENGDQVPAFQAAALRQGERSRRCAQKQDAIPAVHERAVQMAGEDGFDAALLQQSIQTRPRRGLNVTNKRRRVRPGRSQKADSA